MRGLTLANTFLCALAVSPVFLTAGTPGWGAQRGQEAKPEKQRKELPQNLKQAMVAARHAVERDGEGFRAYNQRNKLTVRFGAQAALLDHADGDARLELASYGRVGALRRPRPAKLVADANRVEYRRGALTEWYLNRPQGLEQGFTLAERASGQGSIVVVIGVVGDLDPRLESADAVLLERRGQPVLRYAGLKSWDAGGRSLASRMEVRSRAIRLIVDDAGATYPVTIDPIIGEKAKLTAPDGAAFDGFGSSVALSGDTAIVGALGDDQTRGAAYVFVRSGSTWTQQAKLTASDGAVSDYLGSAVALSGDTAIVGMWGVGKQGAAYVFVRSGSTWTQQAKLTSSSGYYYDRFGCAVALSGDTAIVGATGEDDGAIDAGVAHVFVRSGSTWTEQAKLTNPEPGISDSMGGALALSGDTAVIAVSNDWVNGNHAAGSAYVFIRSGSSWTQQAKLTAPDGMAYDYFGIRVALSGDTAMIDASGDDSFRGSVYVFVRNGSTWTQQAKLTASDGAVGDEFGFPVALSGNTAIVGGAYWYNKGTASGGAYVFQRSGSTWTEQAKLIASDGAAGDQLGCSAALSGDTVILGAPGDDDKGTESGSAYIFSLNQPPIARCKSAAAAAGPACKADASINNGSWDPDGDPITLTQLPPGPYSLGATDVTLTVTDGKGASRQCQATVTVDDATPPAITGASVDKPVLWPPNHKMVDVTVNYNAADNCDLPVCTLAVTSNEPIDGTGDGDTAPDWEILDAHRVRLRAERAGNGNGRIYSVLIGCTDRTANRSTKTVTVSVPHDQGK